MSKKLSLVLALLIPIIFLFLLAFLVFIPNSKIQPAYNFIYSTNDYSTNVNNGGYIVNNSKIEKLFNTGNNCNFEQDYQNNLPVAPCGRNNEQLFIHKVKENKSEKISFEESQKYKLERSTTSPDGFVLELNYSSYFIPFSNNTNGGYTLKKEGVKIPQNFENNYDVRFLGWII